MGETIRLGRIRGISIGVSWTVVVIVGLLMWSLATVTLPDSAPGYADGVYWAVGLLAAIGLMAAILAHEVSHAIVATRMVCTSTASRCGCSAVWPGSAVSPATLAPSCGSRWRDRR